MLLIQASSPSTIYSNAALKPNEHSEKKIQEQMEHLLDYLRTTPQAEDLAPGSQWTYSITFSQPRPTGDIQAFISIANGMSTWCVRAAHAHSTSAFLRAINTLKLTLSQTAVSLGLPSDLRGDPSLNLAGNLPGEATYAA